MDCPQCNHKIDVALIRCPYCGFSIKADETVQTVSAADSTPAGSASPAAGQSSLSDLFADRDLAQAFLALESATEQKRASRRMGGLGKLILFAASLGGGALLTWFLIN
jgi:hypothetical protein